MQKKIKIILFVPDALSIRNYLYSDFVNELLLLNFDVVLYHDISNDALNEIKKVQKNFQRIFKIPFFVENFKSRILRESIAYARLLHNKKILKNNSIIYFWNRKNGNWKQIILYRLAEIIGFMLSKSNKFVQYADQLYDNEIAKATQINLIEKDLKSINPDLILNLHPRTISSGLIACAAKKLNIKTATVIYSWDNVPKARLIARYNHYFVWSELMKNELNLLYSDINLNQISVVGTPQFEFYFNDKFLLEKEVFFNKYGLDSNKKTICYSANDLSSPYEQNYFEDLCQEINKINILERPQILFRNCPVDKSNRFDQTLKKYNTFVHAVEPDWKIDEKGNIYPTYYDFYLLYNTLKNSDLVINLGSTMAHDFAVFDKPCLYLNYDQVKNSKYKVKNVYQFQHFRSMKNLDAVGWINSKNEFIPKILETLNNPTKIGKDRSLWMQKIVNHPLQGNSKNLSEKINSICTFVS